MCIRDRLYNVDEMDYSVFRLDDGDVMTVDAVLDRFENKVEVSGACLLYTSRCV